MSTAQENEAQGASVQPQAPGTGGDLAWDPALTGVPALNLLFEADVGSSASTDTQVLSVLG